MRTHLAKPLALLLLAAPAAQAQQPSRADTAAVGQIITDEIAAWNKGDAKAFTAHVLPDCVFTNTIGEVRTGRAAFEAQHAAIFATIYKGTTLMLATTHLRAIAPTVIIVDTDAAVAGSKWLPPWAEVTNGAITARLEQVMLKQHGSWGITSYHNVFVAKPEH